MSKKDDLLKASADVFGGESAFFPSQPTPKQPQSPTPVLTDTQEKADTKIVETEQTNETTVKRTGERLNERKKIRHTFDIFGDQLLSLREISLERERIFGDRVLLGDLVQEALDMFITKERNKE